MRVLVVDDNEDVRVLLRCLLEAEGVEFGEAPSGTEALRHLGDRGALPDVLLLDIQMPDMDGWETLDAIRSDPATASLPVILCTVKGRPVDSVRGWEAGCDGYVEKPFDIEEILAEVRAVASRSLEDRVARRRTGLGRARVELAEVERFSGGGSVMDHGEHRTIEFALEGEERTWRSEHSSWTIRRTYAC